MSNVTSLAAHPRRALPASAIECLCALAGMQIEDFGRPANYHLRRSKAGAEVWTTFDGDGRLQVNMSVHHQYWPATFAEARKWAAQTFPGLPERKRSPAPSSTQQGDEN